MSEDLILNEIDNNAEEYIEFLRELIQSNSYNPPGNEKNVALKIENYLKKAGIKCEIFPFGENRANLVAYLNDNFEDKNLLYNGHMDVVPPGIEEEWKYPPLSAIIKGSKAKRKIFGRGSVDMKSGLAAMVIAFKILKKLDIINSGNLILNAVADEEVNGDVGTLWCLENVLKSKKLDFVIIGEPTGIDPLSKAVIIGEKGRVAVKIITNGISGHASVPIMGRNAIYMMSEIIQNLDRLESIFPKIEPPLSKEELKDLISVIF
ncbi:MAG: M20 family metallopeptidase, partial [Promethearchaeota archaeon]